MFCELPLFSLVRVCHYYYLYLTEKNSLTEAKENSSPLKKLFTFLGSSTSIGNGKKHKFMVLRIQSLYFTGERENR
jgi:hypothetical protein